MVADEMVKVNSLIQSVLASDIALLNQVNNYIYDVKGKQLRPLLSLLAAKASAEQLTEMSYGCAVVAEIIHTATLLHDDVADNAHTRRGSDTVQYRFSPGFSVLTGDYWLSKALALLVEQEDLELMQLFATAVQQLSEGELFQLEKAEDLDTNKEDYIAIVTNKTSSLFIAAIVGGAHSVAASKEVKETMRNYAFNLGVAFQIRDDIFDYLPDLNTGKEVGSDIKDKKMTLPLICALENSPEGDAKAMVDYIKRSEGDDPKLVEEVFAFVDKYQGVARAEESMLDYSNRAIVNISGIRDSIYKESLKSLASYVGERLL